MRTEIVRYVKDLGFTTGKAPVYLGVVVAIGPGQIGWAKTHENDRWRWNRKLGLKIARGRAALPQGGDHRRRMEEHIPDDFMTPVLAIHEESLKMEA